MNLKMALALLSILNVASINAAAVPKKDDTTIKMPSAEILAERLNANHFDHFVETTGIHKQLGDQKLYPIVVALKMEYCLDDYTRNLNNPLIARLMNMRKNELLETLLQDSPKECNQLLKDLGLSAPNDNKKTDAKNNL